MRKVTFYLKKYFTAEGHAQIDRERAQRRSGGTQTPRTGTSTPSSTGHEHEWPSGGNPTRSHRPPPSGVTVSDRPVGQQRPRRRRRRRTASPVGLPLYSEEPRDQEMSLFKHQTADLSMSSSRLDLALPSTAEAGELSDNEDDDEDDEEDDEDVVTGSGRDFVRPSFDNSASDHGLHTTLTSSRGRASSLSPVPLSATRPRSASESLVGMSRNPYGSNSSSPFASRSGLIDLPPGNLNSASLSPTASRDGTSTPPRGFFGHRPTRSSPISRRASSPPRPAFGRPRASTLQRVLGNLDSSSTFLPIGTPGRSPYGQSTTRSGSNSPIANRSVQRFANVSTTSINTLDISEPVPGSFVHSSFVFPKTGPTPEQVKFIASRENLGAYGYFGHSPSTPPPFDPSDSPLLSSPRSPPSPSTSPNASDLAYALGRPMSLAHVQGRGRSGSSPLARRRSLSPPPDAEDRRHRLAVELRQDETGHDEREAGDERDADLPFTVDDETEEVPREPLPESVASFNIRLDHNAGLDSFPQQPPPFRRLNTSSPPPRIVTQSATPIHSAQPSPALLQESEVFQRPRSRENSAAGRAAFSQRDEPDVKLALTSSST
ncbi:uncharacterized protein JCM15063_004144 [Sporobolomyces koalae]|uniref:uncharacterized protein n=1 Tax=Sporobolomyces koalae TaxID=500713 RepID=UPI0031715C6F